MLNISLLYMYLLEFLIQNCNSCVIICSLCCPFLLVITDFTCLSLQRPLFFSFKMGLPSAIGQAVKLSAAAYIFSGVLILFLQDQFGSHIKMGNFILEQIIFYVGIFSVCLCWELSHHLHQVCCSTTYFSVISFCTCYMIKLYHFFHTSTLSQLCDS